MADELALPVDSSLVEVKAENLQISQSLSSSEAVNSEHTNFPSMDDDAGEVTEPNTTKQTDSNVFSLWSEWPKKTFQQFKSSVESMGIKQWKNFSTHSRILIVPLIIIVFFAIVVIIDGSYEKITPPSEPSPSGATSISVATVQPYMTSDVSKWGSLTPTNPQSGDIWYDPKYDITFVYIPAGRFVMGSTEQERRDALAECEKFHDQGECKLADLQDESQRSITLEDFWMIQTEVSIAQYQMCVDAGACTKPTTESECVSAYWRLLRQQDCASVPDEGHFQLDKLAFYPVNGVNWTQANLYALWVGGRLPSEAEWEKAARGPSRFIYPWGNEWNGENLNYCDDNCIKRMYWKDTEWNDGYAELAPVGSYPNGKSSYGIFGMAGNVWEWTADWYDFPCYGGNVKCRVIRGGSWVSDRPSVRSVDRQGASPDYAYIYGGVRVVRD